MSRIIGAPTGGREGVQLLHVTVTPRPRTTVSLWDFGPYSHRITTALTESEGGQGELPPHRGPAPAGAGPLIWEVFMEQLRFVDACTEEHFRAMSLIHALGWRDTYADAVPADYMASEITDDRWVEVFRANYETQNGVHGLLLCRGGEPVSCLNYWGEIASFYTHPAQRGRGYGGLLFDEACRRMKEAGFANAFVFVLRENEKARRFYAAHGFAWDGTHADIPFPHDTVCVDLRYVKQL